MLESSELLCDSSAMTNDALSSAFRLFEAHAVYAGGLKAGGSWAIKFQPPKEFKFFTVGKGTCLLTMEGQATVRLEQGDVFILREPLGFRLASDLTANVVDAEDVFANRGHDTVEIGTADEVLFLGCHLALGSPGSRELMEALPPSLHIKATDPGTERLNWLIKEFVAEAEIEVPGGESAREQLANLIFLGTLRICLSRPGGPEAGWLRAIFDPRIGPVMSLMHGDPSHEWGLSELAAQAGMSRTAFATHFKAVAGVPPLSYLTLWRMRLAERRLRDGQDMIGTVARSVGYESEAAFSTAFKRVIGHPPRRSRTGG